MDLHQNSPVCLFVSYAKVLAFLCMHMKMHRYATPYAGCLKYRLRTGFQSGTLYKMDPTKGMAFRFFMGRHIPFSKFPGLSNEFSAGLLNGVLV